MSIIRTLILATTAVLLPVTAQADRPASAPDLTARFAEIDADGDSRVTQAELYAHRKGRFASIDTDGDGVVSVDELSAEQNKRRMRSIAFKLQRMDTDGDGSVNADEYARAHAHKMHRLDANRDGALDAAEMRRAADGRKRDCGRRRH